MKKIISVLLTFVMLLCTVSVGASAVDNDCEHGFLDLGTTQMEYAVYGNENAQPLVLIPGNGGDMNALMNIAPALMERYKIIMFSPRGTGNTKIGDDVQLTFELEAEDLSKLLDHLNIDKTYIYGFSDGGNLAIVFTLLYPDRVEKMVTHSPNINIFGTKPIKQLTIMWQYFILCIESVFKSDPDFVRQREIKGMMAHQPNLKYIDLEQINVPTLHIYAENDMMKRSHCEKISKHIPNCKTVILEGQDHTSAFARADELIIPELFDFFG